MYTRKNTEYGFSLIELMVSLTIFSIVMTIAFGTLLVLIDANAKAQALSSSMTNLSFAIDSMTRNLRTGKEFHCASSYSSSVMPDADDVQDCPSSLNASFIAFTPGFETNRRIGYRLSNGRIEQIIDRTGSTDSWVPITSDQPPAAVTVTTLKFIVDGSEGNITANDDEQPNISILISGTVSNGLEEPTSFQIQSRVTQRVLNY
jgi:prepilin-type N-terminal cleavage/methylation domain-containing protein